jgi:hypothetical protein
MVPADRVHIRDHKTFCAILLDDSNQKPIARLYLNDKEKKTICVYGANKEKKYFQIDGTTCIYKYKRQIRNTIKSYLEKTKKPTADSHVVEPVDSTEKS